MEAFENFIFKKCPGSLFPAALVGLDGTFVGESEKKRKKSPQKEFPQHSSHRALCTPGSSGQHRCACFPAGPAETHGHPAAAPVVFSR